MAHVAKLNTDYIDAGNLGKIYIVDQVIVVSNNESDPVAFCEQLLGDGMFIQTSYNNKIRNTFAFPGAYYIESLDIFIHPKPYDSWLFDATNYEWFAPVDHPPDGNYEWNEKTLSWNKAVLTIK